MKQILVSSCNDCHYRDHSGGFTPGGAYPVCGNKETCLNRGNPWRNRMLPINDELHRQYTGEIPKWCPLKNAPVKTGLSLYIWTDFCPEYTDGLAFAIAKNEKMARAQIIKERGSEPHDWGTLEVRRLDFRTARSASGGS